MKKLFLLGFLAVSSLLMADDEYTFRANHTYCKNPKYDTMTMYLDNDGKPYVAIRFLTCYHKDKKISGSPFILYLHFNNSKFYRDLEVKEHPYVFFKDGSLISVVEKNNETQWSMGLDEGDASFKNEWEYY